MGPSRSYATACTIAELSTTPVSGLLKLPESLLQLIMSFLGTKSRAAARLSCRDLRNALIGQQRVTIRFDEWYSASVCASPAVLRLIHANASIMARLDAAKQKAKLASIPPFYHDSRLRFLLQSELLANVAREVSALSVGWSWCFGAAGFQGNTIDFIAPGQLHVALSRMPRLTSLIVDGTLDMPTAIELVDLRFLASVEVALLPQQDVIHSLCHMPALTRLDLGLDVGPHEMDDYGWVPGCLKTLQRG